MRPGSSGAEVLGQGIDNVSRLLPIASELGVTVLAGSDLAIDVGDIGREVAALNALGLPIEDAVAGASYRGRSALGIPSALGPGTPADLVAFDVDPTEDPQILAEPRFVIAGGEVLADRM
jgi:imidazolonepropionase-like amidohydrolase